MKDKGFCVDGIFYARWEIPATATNLAVNELLRILFERDETNQELKNNARTRISAARTLLAFHRQALADGLSERRLASQYERTAEEQRARLAEIARQLGLDTPDCDQRRLVEWLERRGGSATPREVQMGCRWLREPGEAQAALDDLVQAGLGCWQAEPNMANRGPTACKFFLSTPSTSTSLPETAE